MREAPVPPPAGRLPARGSSVLPGCALMALALLVYFPCLNGPLLWDDPTWLPGKGWSLRGVAGLWRIWSVPGSFQQYYPVTATSFWLDHHLWGQGSTLPHHLENVLLHGGACVLFWLLLRRLHARGAWFAAALFAVHPMMAESVAWITERKNVLCAFFSLAALLLHGAESGWWESRCRGTIRTRAAAFLLFALALLAKISAVVLPAAVLVIGWWRHGHVRWRADGLRLLPWWLIIIPVLLLALGLEHAQIAGGDPTPALTVAQRLLLAGQLPWFYLGKLAWPRHLCVLYEQWTLRPALWWHWTGHAALLIVLALFLVQRRRGATALTLLYLGALFPVLGCIDVNGMKYAWAADRWVHLPALAAFAAAGDLLHRIPFAWARNAIAALLLAGCAWLCRQQAALYGDADRFWQAAIAGNRNPWKAHNDYAGDLSDRGRYEESVRHCEAALRLRPDYVAAHLNLAGALDGLGRRTEAVVHLDRALALQPEHNAVGYYNRAIILEHMGRTAEAEAALRVAIRQEPRFFAAHNDLGNLLLLAGRQDEAISCFETMLKLRPGNAQALTWIGNVHFLRGDHSRALALFEAALRDDPDLVSALANSAWILATQPDATRPDAAKALRCALRAAERTNHNDPSVLQVLAAAHANAGDFENAVLISRKAAALARSQGKHSLAESIDACNAFFERKEPWRVPPR